MENQKTNKSVLDRIKERQEKANSAKTNTTQGGYEKIDWDALKKKRFYPQSEKELFRLVPFADNEVFKEVYYHFIMVNGKWEQIYCEKHNDNHHCPLCEASSASYNYAKTVTDPKEQEKHKLNGYKFKVSKFYLVQGVDMNKMNDGKKLWLFREDKKNKGVYDLIMELFNEYGDISDYKSGYDLTIKCGKNEKGKMSLTSVMCVKQTNLEERLSMNDIKIEDIINEKVDWQIVYGKKNIARLTHEEFLTKIVEGNAPYWSKNDKKWIYPLESKTTNNTPNDSDSNPVEDDAQEETFVDDSVSIDASSDDDLPF
jgi:hypothetical protein